MIEANAARVRKKGQRNVLPKRLPLDFTQPVAARRADRVAAWKQIEASNHHQYDIQKAVELENQFNERHRMEDRLRLGGLPASISHPIAAAMVRAAAPAAQPAAAAPMDVDAPAPPRRKLSTAEAAAEARELMSLLVPNPRLGGTEARVKGVQVLTQAEMTARMTLTNARANPAAVASGNEKMRLRNIEYGKLPRGGGGGD